MTIIEPTKNKYYSREFLYLIGLILIVTILNIYFYNLNVNLKYQISIHEKSLQQLDAANAEIRNQLYQMLDSKNLVSLIQEHNLVSDKNPDYFEHQILANL